MNEIRIDNRQTGRTTRMLDAARKALQEGKTVTVIMANLREVQRALRLMEGEDKTKLCITTEKMARIEWQTGRPYGCRGEFATFMDHFCYEPGGQSVKPQTWKE